MMPYTTLIIAGIGSIGKAFLKLAGPFMDRFETVLLVDVRPQVLQNHHGPDNNGYGTLLGNVSDPACIAEALNGLTKPAIFLNLCSGVDTVKLRSMLSRYPVAYIDSGASSLPGEALSSFMEIMPYTNSPCHGPYPHLLCQGINPGMVELVARKLMKEFPKAEQDFEVVIQEEDTLTASMADGSIAVGWSPEDLVEEVMLAPALEVVNGLPVEMTPAGSLKTYANTRNSDVSARIVAHEDIWNLALVPGVRKARFFYRLHESVMKVFDGSPADALRKLKVPDLETPVYGKDAVTVVVKSISSGRCRSLAWSVDHHETWRRESMNGVQFQTGKALLFSLLYLLENGQNLAGGTYNSATLPVDDGSWVLIERLFAKLGIDWQEVEFTGIGAEGAANE